MLEYEYLDGCNFSLTVNGEETVDMDTEVLRRYIERLVRIDNDFDEIKRLYLKVCEIRYYLYDYDEKEDTPEFWERFDEMKLSKDDDLESIKNKLNEIVNIETDTSIFQNIMMDILERLGEYTDIGYCETCGSYNKYYTLVLED